MSIQFNSFKVASCKENEISTMKCMISAVVLVTLVMIARSHPLCQPDVNFTISEATCYVNVTANVSFLNEWLSLRDDSPGINQLRSRKDTIVSKLLQQLTSKVCYLISWSKQITFTLSIIIVCSIILVV